VRALGSVTARASSREQPPQYVTRVRLCGPGLSKSLTRLSHATGQTVALFEQLHLDLDAMRTLAGIHSAQFMTVAAELDPDRYAEEQQKGGEGGEGES